jgi:predicted DNA-binding ribbon-helix-helix protein
MGRSVFNDRAKMKKHSLTIDGHRTSISLEDEFWEGLNQIALEQQQPLINIVKEIDENRVGSLSSAIRIFVFNYMRK